MAIGTNESCEWNVYRMWTGNNPLFLDCLFSIWWINVFICGFTNVNKRYLNETSLFQNTEVKQCSSCKLYWALHLQQEVRPQLSCHLWLGRKGKHSSCQQQATRTVYMDLLGNVYIGVHKAHLVSSRAWYRPLTLAPCVSCPEIRIKQMLFHQQALDMKHLEKG